MAKVNQKNLYSVDQAVERIKEMASAKFIESVDIAVRLGVDPKKADQAVRGTVALPNGIGKSTPPRMPNVRRTLSTCESGDS